MSVKYTNTNNVEKVTFNVEGAKGGSSSSHTPVEAPDSLRSLAKARILVLLGEGPVAGNLTSQKIFLDGTPLANADGSMNFDNVSWEFRNGTQSQEPIKGFPAVESETTIGTDLTYGGTGWNYSINNTAIDAVNIRIGFPALYKQESNGDLNGSRVDYQIYVATDGGSFNLVGSYAAVGKTTTLYERTHRVNLPSANTGWQIRVIRNTADSTSATLVNPTSIQAITTIIDARLRYPMSAILFVQYDAEVFDGRVPKISCLLDGKSIRIPSNYNPVTRSYAGTWDGTFVYGFTNNPAWVFLDIATDARYGLGKRIGLQNLDKWELYRIAQRCDQMVPDGHGGTGTEPRFTFNAYIQSRADAWTVLKDIAAGFAGMTFWANNVLNVLSDMPGDVAQVVTRASVVNGKFVRSSGSIKNHYSSFKVNYSDPNNHYNDVTTGGFEADLMARYGEEALEITAIGCTRESEAQRRGRWALMTNDIDENIQFSVGAEGIDFMPGDIIGIADERFAGRVLGGRVSSATPLTVKTDVVTDGVAGDSFMINIGGAVYKRDIASVSGRDITLTSSLPSAPAPESVFVIDAENLALQYFRVTSITPDENGTYKVVGAQYSQEKYDAIDSGARIDSGRPTSLIPTGVVNMPSNVSVSAFDVLSQGQRIATMQATWDAPIDDDGKPQKNIVSYEIQWKRDDNPWINAGKLGQRNFVVSGIYEGDYLVRVRAINSAGASSLWSSSALTHLTGRQGEVPPLINFAATDDQVFAIKLSWLFDNDTADSAFTEIEYSTTNDVGSMGPLAYVPYPQKEYQQSGLASGVTLYYRARLVDKLGNVSAWSPIVYGQSSFDADAIIDVIDDAIRNSDQFKAISEGVDTNIDAILQRALDNDAMVTYQFKQYGENKAEIVNVKTTVANELGAFAEELDQVQVTVGENTAAIATKATTQFDTGGNGNATYSVNAGVTFNGTFFSAGMAIGVSTVSGVTTSSVLFNAGTFAVYNGTADNNALPFVITGGQIYLRDAFIGDGTITNAKIGNFIRSTNFVSGVSGWNIQKDGTAEFQSGTFRGTISASNGNFNLSGPGNTTVIDGKGITVNLSGGGMVRVGSW